MEGMHAIVSIKIVVSANNGSRQEIGWGRCELIGSMGAIDVDCIIVYLQFLELGDVHGHFNHLFVRHDHSATCTPSIDRSACTKSFN